MALRRVSQKKRMLAILLVVVFVLVLLARIKPASDFPSSLSSSPSQSFSSPLKYEDRRGEKLAPVVSTSLTQEDKHKDLTADVIRGVKKFVLFVGYERSGHSIVGSLMNAHPHVVIAHEFCLFNKFDVLDKVPRDTWRDNLFWFLYRDSNKSKVMSSSFKGYTLKVEGLWEGTYDDHIEVIGDKSGGMTTRSYLIDKQKFKQNFEKLKQSVQVPLHIIHVLRNPFDIISTNAIYTKSNLLLKRLKETGRKTTSPELHRNIMYMFGKFQAVTEIIEDIVGRENVLDIHNCDLVADPRGTLTKIFNFLEVSTTEHYLDVCAEKVFKSVSRTRDLMEWPPELREMVETKMKEYEMFSRYSFTSD